MSVRVSVLSKKHGPTYKVMVSLGSEINIYKFVVSGATDVGLSSKLQKKECNEVLDVRTKVTQFKDQKFVFLA